VTVFGSARIPEGHPDYELGRRMGAALADAGFTVMTGGGPGLMEAANRGGREAGGRSIGCNITLPVEQQPNPYLDRVVTLQHFFIRKVLLVKYSYGFIALPGGFGTFDEIFEAATLVQTGKIARFPIVLLGRDFWTPIMEMLDRQLVENGLVSALDLAHFFVTDSPDEAAAHVLLEATGTFGLGSRPVKRRWWLAELPTSRSRRAPVTRRPKH
jgi:uncharacterized protein (TIGR00730 family)